MKLLLDTCTFLWLAGGGRSLSATAAEAVRDPSNDVLLSAVSTWEIVVKHRMGRLPLPESPERLIPTERRLRGVPTLLFDEDSALQGLRLPPLHRDPFDRLLIAQAIALGLAIVTPDPLITQYPVRVIW
jgi:PIN domain nuclease of toxin-antitoxin system